MSGHSEGSTDSKRICDLLYDALSQRIPDLRRTQTEKWCGLHRTGMRRFAYVAHRTSTGGVQVWCAGDPSSLATAGRGLRVVPRENTPKRGWEQNFPARFTIETEDQVGPAADMLYSVSYLSSRP